MDTVLSYSSSHKIIGSKVMGQRSLKGHGSKVKHSLTIQKNSTDFQCYAAFQNPSFKLTQNLHTEVVNFVLNNPMIAFFIVVMYTCAMC